MKLPFSIVLIFFSTVVYFSSSDTNYLGETSFFFVPNNWQILLETTYDAIYIYFI